MQAIVMAAGLGTRLKDKTENVPKALVKVLGKELLHYVIEFLNRDEIDEILVVVGYRGYKIEEFIASKKFQKRIRILRNNEFKKGNILSLLTALPEVRESFILMNVDHIYYNPKIFDIITQNIRGITAVCDFDRRLGDDDMKVLIENDRIVKISKSLVDYTGGYVGLTLVPPNKLERYREVTEELARKHEGNVNVEAILQTLADEGELIYYKDISGLGWVEVDTQEDLILAEEKLKRWYEIRRDRNTPHPDGL